MYLYTDSLAWMALAAVGIAFGVLSIVEAQRDMVALRAAGQNGAKKRLARMALTTEALRVGAQTIFFVLGVLAAFNPVRTQWSISVMMIMVAELLLVVNTVVMYRERGEVLKELVFRENEDVAKQSTLLDVQEDVKTVQEGVDEVKEAAFVSDAAASKLSNKVEALTRRVDDEAN